MPLTRSSDISVARIRTIPIKLNKFDVHFYGYQFSLLYRIYYIKIITLTNFIQQCKLKINTFLIFFTVPNLSLATKKNNLINISKSFFCVRFDGDIFWLAKSPIIRSCCRRYCTSIDDFLPTLFKSYSTYRVHITLHLVMQHKMSIFVLVYFFQLKGKNCTCTHPHNVTTLLTWWSRKCNYLLMISMGIFVTLHFLTAFQ